MTILPHHRPVLSFEEPEFGAALGKVLSASRPLQSEEMLRGREEQMAGIRQAFYAPGRHVLIHGFRGVGKSSLAQSAAFSIAEKSDPIIVACDPKSSFSSIIADIFNEAGNNNPAFEKKVTETGWGFANSGVSIGDKTTIQEGQPLAPSSVNLAVRQIQYLCETYAPKPVIVVDEFDQLKDKDEQRSFANFIKQVSDKHVEAQFIFCGIGESIDMLMAAHESADRYFHTVGLGRLPWEARFEIVRVAADALGIQIDDDAIIRIARISDGFPHYIHFLSEKLFWHVYHKENNGLVTAEIFEAAMSDAAKSMDMKLRGPYELAIQKYTNDYQTVLWATADGHELRRRSSDIFESYKRIMTQRRTHALDRSTFNQRINSLKQPSHGAILSATRQGWYEFTEKVIRGYIRLRAEQDGVILEADHPAAPRRIASGVMR